MLRNSGTSQRRGIRKSVPPTGTCLIVFLVFPLRPTSGLLMNTDVAIWGSTIPSRFIEIQNTVTV